MDSPALAPLWTPSAERVARANLTAFTREFEARCGKALPDYGALWRESNAQRAQFWSAVWDFCGVRGVRGARTLADGDRMPGAKWFPDAQLNFAANLLAHCPPDDPRDAIVFRGEAGATRRISRGELRALVSRAAAALRACGVVPGDRVAAYVANVPEAIVGMLATTSLGAVWSSCSPDFGVEGVLDRFGQIEPVVLFAVDGYRYAGKAISTVAKVAAIADRLPSVRRVVMIAGPDAASIAPDPAAIRSAQTWHDFMKAHPAGEIEFPLFAFDHPVYILYSSGTTGVPKCIVHGAGGTLIQHLKEHVLHGDVRPYDRLFYFTTCGWMMWNWLASGLAAGAALMLYDGSPFAPAPMSLWEYADEERFTHFGTSAKYLDAAGKEAVRPRERLALAELRTIFSTGSPLAAEGFDYVYACIKSDVLLASISGGTDIVACFATAVPTRPVWRGELQGRALGMQVDAFDPHGRPIAPGSGERGELVCTAPFPSMPIGFWNDPDGSRYRAAYFERFEGVWCHGDFVELTAHDGMIIYGRSDATLNPGGVRIGTAEIYRQVESMEEIAESLVIGQDWPPGALGDVRVVLFVRLREGLSLDATLEARIRARIRERTTPRHVPAKIVAVTDIPRTRSNKIVELAVRDVVHGRPVPNMEALANPEALAQYRDREELRT